MPRRVVTPKKPIELVRSRTPLILAGLLVVGLGITAGAIAWGRSDSGEINVAATINNSRERDAESGETVQQAATAEHSSLPNGGLVAAEGDAPQPPTPVVEEPVSTTTESESDSDAGDEATDPAPEGEADEGEATQTQ